MKKKATLKKIVLFCIIAAVLVFAVGSIIGSDKPIFTQEESIEDWAAYFEESTAPEGCALYHKGYGIGMENASSSGRAFYGYYWIIKNENANLHDVSAYYLQYAKHADINMITTEELLGHDEEGNVSYPIFPIHTSYAIDGLEEVLDGLTEEDLLENDYYILYVIQYGS